MTCPAWSTAPPPLMYLRPDGIAPIQSSFCDVDNDGFLDAMYVFDLQELVDYGVEDELLSLSFSVDGEVFVLEDEVVFVGKPG